MKYLATGALCALLMAACSAQPPTEDAAVANSLTVSANPAPAAESEVDLQLAVQRALALEGLNNVTISVEGSDVRLGGWVYSPTDKILARNVVRSVHGVDDVAFLDIRVG